MSELQAFAAAVLTVTLGAAAAGKLRSPGRFRAALATYKGLPRSLHRPLTVAVPIAEAGLAGLLWWDPTRTAAAASALALLAAFTGLLAVQIASGTEADCGCFGSRRAEPVGWFSLVRNGALMAAAAAVLVPSGDRGSLLAPVLAGSGTAAVLLLLDAAMATLAASARDS